MANMTLCSEEYVEVTNPVMRVQPAITETHHPIPHITVINQIKKNLSLLGNFEVANEQYGISHEGQRMFGVMGLYDLDKGPNSDYELVIGCRNSHDKAFAAAASFGTSTFVCSNLIFTGDVVISRKHTSNILVDFPDMVGNALVELADNSKVLEARFDHYTNCWVCDEQVHDVLFKADDANAVKRSAIHKVRQEWLKPSHEEFEPRNAYSLMQAFTECEKGSPMLDQTRRTQRLTDLLDREFNFDPAKALKQLEPEHVVVA